MASVTTTYRLAEVFRTLQGEGLYAGHPAIFVRFAGCNLWGGNHDHRDRDAERNEAACPRWCDTDFNPKHTYSLQELGEAIFGLPRTPLVVFTGGEPLLQLDIDLVMACRSQGMITALETNGTVKAKPGVLEQLNHVCVSPKHPVDKLVLIPQMARDGWDRLWPSGKKTTELKVVVPAYDPLAYESIRRKFTRAYVSPEAVTQGLGVSVLAEDTQRRAAEFCLQNPGWALSLQTHKILGLR